MMVVRVIISLKKVASERQSYSGLEVPPVVSTRLRGGHSPHPVDGISLLGVNGPDNRRVNPARVGFRPRANRTFSWFSD